MHPSVPRLLRIVLVLATTASLLAFPLTASAAPKGKQVTVEITPLTTAVSPGQLAAFQAVIHNNGSATLTHAALTVEVTGGTLVTPTNGCTGGGAGATCDLDSLDGGELVVLNFFVNAPGVGGMVELTGTLTVDAAGGNPNAASKDVFSSDDEVAIRADGRFFGTWHPANQALSSSTAAIGGNKHQSTAFEVPSVGFSYAAAVEELNARVCGERGIGDAIDLQLADGETVSPFLKVTVTYDSEARGNRSPGNVGFVHEDDNGGCHFLTSGCATVGCFNAWWSGHGPNKLLVVEALLPSNGRGKGL